MTTSAAAKAAHRFDVGDEVLVSATQAMAGPTSATHYGEVFALFLNTATGRYVYGIASRSGLVWWRAEDQLVPKDAPFKVMEPTA